MIGRVLRVLPFEPHQGLIEAVVAAAVVGDVGVEFLGEVVLKGLVVVDLPAETVGVAVGRDRQLGVGIALFGGTDPARVLVGRVRDDAADLLAGEVVTGVFLFLAVGLWTPAQFGVEAAELPQ
ncbi:hypothetical protein C488_00382 [Natrinema pellirubrum DSM 15624]|uniref:Uncharacterized protein n=1 Tax=Natrinema pellirubrum (strain DSM 15624 / CIP 106293 / JCM 10476 / NCIMB 786 / 157) TaxID=797303 RepID=L9ZA59_NATP1|nr:hypothetical protein C488_00382 [Natrinema pellirubrum DSM 15624]